ncbi:hypothetical protein B6U98_05060 [Thermoplasmatales archaeon ex4572_165]|nr:MAG: hypothetical protein B6U98_05060 [Thermoplasmatales archaeon ex4572_165]RLF59425.1 MAG: hypothetical protein DRN27_02695 [Thermoplasmata archaeon]
MQKTIYEETLKIGLVLNIIFIFTSCAILIPTIYSLYLGEIIATLILLISLVFTLIIIYAVLPKKYQIYNDKIKIVCGLFSIKIPFDNIEYIDIHPSSNIYASLDALRFGTGTGQKCVMIKRKHGMNVLIQPMNTERFMEIINKKIKNTD